MKDFIIVGAGLAGISFAETAFANGKSFMVISDDSQNSSRVAGGLYNPVIVKRLSLVQDSAVHLEYMFPFYRNIEARLNTTFVHPVPLLRKFASVEEQNNWYQAADKPALEPFLSTELQPQQSDFLPSPFGLGKVNKTGYVDTNTLLTSYHDFLRSMVSVIYETFDYSALVIGDDTVSYKGIEAKHIIFAEGYGIHANPFFNYLPLNGTKGELLVIKAPELKLNVAVNAGVFILPVGHDLYRVGATYEWTDKTSLPTGAGRKELVEKLEELITCKYEIVDHLAGIRPTVKDRKALIGTHHEYKNVHLLNGLGTRGVILGPAMAKELYDSIVNGNPVKREINLNRFEAPTF